MIAPTCILYFYTHRATGLVTVTAQFAIKILSPLRMHRVRSWRAGPTAATMQAASCIAADEWRQGASRCLMW